eukprot:4655463-Amphidinium_carterae.1
MRFRQYVTTDPAFAARVGLTREQVQQARDRGLLPEVGPASGPSAAAVSGTAGVGSGSSVRAGSTSGTAVPGGASGPSPTTGAGVSSGTTPLQESKTRSAEELAEDDQQAHKFARLADDDEDEVISTLYGITRLTKDGEVTDVAVTVPMEHNPL